MSHLITNLELFGFSKKEAQIYIELLKTWSTSIWTLEKNLWEKRQTILYSLKKLISRGFVSVIESRSHPIYSAESPEIIQFEYQEKQKNLQQIIQNLQDIKKTSKLWHKSEILPCWSDRKPILKTYFSERILCNHRFRLHHKI